MIGIADSGSTKTDWVFISEDGAETQRFVSQGLNPFYNTESDVHKVAEIAVPLQVRKRINRLYFYGAGCSSQKRVNVMETGLSAAFLQAKVDVHHDLLAAARATAGRNKGIVSILGTGSNTCAFDGSKIIDQVPNLGFFLGDEGSGAVIGRELLRMRCYREMPDDLQEKFDVMFSFDREQMMTQLYGSKIPSRVAADYAKFCSAQRTSPMIQELLNRVFSEFIKRHLVKYNHPDWPCHFVGSIASAFKLELKQALSDYDLVLGRVIQHPIEALVDYHRGANEI